MQIPFKESTSILSEYNKNLDGKYYDLVHGGTDKFYVPFFDISSKETRYYMEAIRYFAEKRDYKKTHGEKLKLDEDKMFLEYIDRVLKDMFTIPNSFLTSYGSIISFKTKELVLAKGEKMGIQNYINSKMGVFKSLLSTYTELRNVTYEIINYYEGLKLSTRRTLETVSKWQYSSLEEDNYPEKEEGEQYELADYYLFPRVRKKGTK